MASARLAARCVTPDHARAIAETGGAIGIWHIFPDLDKYVDGLKEMVDVIGVDHVCVGTDQQVVPGALQDYSQWVNLIVAMLRGGALLMRRERLPVATTCAYSALRWDEPSSTGQRANGQAKGVL